MEDLAFESLCELRFDPNHPSPHVALREKLFAVLADAGFAMGDAQERTEVLASSEPYLFLAFCRDGDHDYFAAVPESRITPPLDGAVAALESTTFVGAEDFTPARFAALLRIWATLARTLDGKPATGLARWIEQETAGWSEENKRLLPDVAELATLDGRWRDCLSRKPSHYDQRYTRVLALRQMT